MWCKNDNGEVYNDIMLEDLVTGYLSLMCVLRNMAPDSVMKTYLPGIAAWFDKERASCAKAFRCAINSKEVKFIYRGLIRAHAKLNPSAGKIKLPYGMDLAIRSKAVMRFKNMFNEFGQTGMRILQKRVYVAQAMAINFLLRKSEHIEPDKGAVVGTATKFTRKHLTFFDADDTPIRYAKVGKIKAMSVAINIPYAKTDLKGHGRITRHARQAESSEIDIVKILEDWIKDTRDNFDTKEFEAVYAVKGFETFNVNTLHRVMQYTLDDLGVVGLHATSHSLRYGGATMLAAAGFPHYVIAMYGGWSEDSKVLRLYTKASKQLVEVVSAHMATMALVEGSKFFINDVLIVAKGRVSHK